MHKTFNIEVLSWDTFNPRKDIKRPAWFAFSNRMIEDPEFFSFTALEFKAWIYVLSLASQKNCAAVHVNSEHAERVCGIDVHSLESSLKKLSALKILKISKKARTDRVRESSDSVRYRTDSTGQDKQTEQNITSTPEERPPAVPPGLQQSADFEFFNSIKVISPALSAAWTQSYPEDWILKELAKARIWCLSNPKRSPKNASTFLTNWFSKGWESYRKTIPAEKPKTDYSFLSKAGNS